MRAAALFALALVFTAGAAACRHPRPRGDWRTPYPAVDADGGADRGDAGEGEGDFDPHGPSPHGPRGPRPDGGRPVPPPIVQPGPNDIHI